MKLCILLLFTSLLFLVSSPVSAETILKESTRSKGKDRTYYLFVPDNLRPTTPAPLLILLHGSGRDGLSLVKKWTEFAKQEGIIIAGPNSLNLEDWKIPEDGPDFIHELVETLQAKYPVNS